MERNGCGLLRRQECLRPTWRGWLLLTALAVTASWITLANLHAFLSPSDPPGAAALAVEGWLPDYALQQTVDLLQTGVYSNLYTTGTPLERGAPLVEYESYAQLSAAILRKQGAPSERVHAVPAPLSRKDRTYASAVALRDWFQARGGAPTRLRLISLGAHTRRSRLMFQKAFGSGTIIEATALQPREYDPARWWRSSNGVRTVLDEAIGYVYARFLFWP